MKLGYVDVYEMAKSFTAKQLFEWEAFAQLEPFTELREDYRNAAILHAIYMAAGGKKKLKVEDFLLKFGEQEPPRKKSAQEIWSILELFTKVHNSTPEGSQT